MITTQILLGRSYSSVQERWPALSGSWKKHAAHSSLMAEILAVRDGLSLAISLSLERVLLESDNLEVIQACRKEIQRGEVRTVLEDVWKLKEGIPSYGFTWMERKGNELAHHVAALARMNKLPLNWTCLWYKPVKLVVVGEMG